MIDLKRAVFAFALATIPVTLVSAQTSVATADRSAVLIEYSGPTQLSSDFTGMRIRIRNRSGEDRTWAFDFNARRASFVEIGRQSRFELAVEDGQDRQFEILVPLSTSSDPSWLQMIVYGYGVSNAGQMEVIGNTTSSSVAISTNATLEDQALRDQLTADPSGAAIPYSFPAASLSSDWRAYSSLSVLWLASDEWKQASAVVRRALTDWVAGGGCLVLVEPGDTLGVEPVEFYGLGRIVSIPEALSPDDIGRFETVKPVAPASTNSISWASSLIDPIETHKGLLSLLLLAYLVLAAPVHLFVFSPGTKRMRLFWTMPAIALGTSGLMAGVILLQDGVGGSGYRANFVYLQPELNRELVTQEQVSKTGALLRRSFDIEEPVVIDNLQTEYQPYQKPAELGSRGSRYAGDWFRSRSIQAHRLESARSSRARIELIGMESGAPVIQSSIDAPLEKLFYRAPSGYVWSAENVLPGRPVTLSESHEAQYEQFWRDVSFGTAGPVIRDRVNAVRGIRGAFLAVADADDSDVFIDTLPSIQWTDGPLFYAGYIREARR